MAIDNRHDNSDFQRLFKDLLKETYFQVTLQNICKKFCILFATPVDQLLINS